ncbi:hypothetical protein JXM67_09525 [candidate division WOR-3 bacterium]|nr:hypothetical protein [candidate division WOR-3 bacterium]
MADNAHRGEAARRVLGTAVLLLVMAGCGERFPDPSQQGEFDRVVLLEEATGTWCVNCPAVAENIQTLLADYPGEFIAIALHSQTQDPYSTEETEERLSDFSVDAFPTVIFDGVEAYEGVQTVEEMAQVLSDRRALGTAVKLELDASLTADSVLYEVTVIVSGQTEESIEGILRIALIEDTLTHATAGLLHHIVRRLPEEEAAMTLNPGDSLDLHRSLPLDVSWGRPLTAVVWVEDPDHKVYQAASHEVGGGSYVHGDFSIELVSDSIQTDTLGAILNFYFDLKNHTGNILTLTVDVPEASQYLPENWWFSLCDEQNCYPVPTDFEVPANGTLEGLHVTIGSSILDQETEGKVIMTVTSGEEVDSQTFILEIE